MRKAVAPIVPEAGLAERELAIGLDALTALAMDDFLPDVVRVGKRVLRGFVVGRVFRHDIFQQNRQDIEIVNIAEEILEALKIFDPEDGVIRQKIFNGVAETFDADAQLVPRFGVVGALCAGVEVARFVDAFDGEALRGEARRRNEADAAAELLFETRPGFDVEFFDGAERLIAKLGLGFGEIAMELGSERVAFGGEMLHPVVHHLGVAEDAEATEQFARHAAHFGPGGVRVDLLEDGADGSAASDGDAEVTLLISSVPARNAG